MLERNRQLMLRVSSDYWLNATQSRTWSHQSHILHVGFNANMKKSMLKCRNLVQLIIIVDLVSSRFWINWHRLTKCRISVLSENIYSPLNTILIPFLVPYAPHCQNVLLPISVVIYSYTSLQKQEYSLQVTCRGISLSNRALRKVTKRLYRR